MCLWIKTLMDDCYISLNFREMPTLSRMICLLVFIWSFEELILSWMKLNNDVAESWSKTLKIQVIAEILTYYEFLNSSPKLMPVMPKVISKKMYF